VVDAGEDFVGINCGPGSRLAFTSQPVACEVKAAESGPVEPPS
jgi:hypothetical protein